MLYVYNALHTVFIFQKTTSDEEYFLSMAACAPDFKDVTLASADPDIIDN